jgi:hypothetical protein
VSKKKNLSKAILVSISLLFSQLAYPANGDEWQRVKISYPEKMYVVNTVSQFIEHSGHTSGSTLRFNKPNGDGTITIISCPSFQSPGCIEATPRQMQASITFPRCDAKIKNWCIKEVLLYENGNKSKEAEFVKYIDGDTLVAEPLNRLPQGGTLSLWKIKGDTSANPTLFAVNVVQFMIWDPQPYFFQLSAGIYPVTLKQGKEYFAETINKNEKGEYGAYEYKVSPKCENAIFTSNGECGSKILFPKNLRIGLSIVVPNEVDGFISGRLEDIKLSTYSNDGDLSSKVISIDAHPIKIPRLGLSLTKEQAVAMIGSELGDDGMDWVAEDNRQDGDTLRRFEYLRKYAEDRSSGFSSVWNFTNLSAISSVKRCKIPVGSFPGLISTNAMIVDPNPPSFVDGEFVYQVAGMHYEPDGLTLSSGDYTLVISKFLSDCLYSSSEVPISASVSVINSETGDKKVSVTSIKRDFDYYTLNISGFNFSKPEIRVRFNFAPNKSTIKKSTITCVKGKQSKIITAVSPKCPAGYKKK